MMRAQDRTAIATVATMATRSFHQPPRTNGKKSMAHGHKASVWGLPRVSKKHIVGHRTDVVNQRGLMGHCDFFVAFRTSASGVAHAATNGAQDIGRVKCGVTQVHPQFAVALSVITYPSKRVACIRLARMVSRGSRKCVGSMPRKTPLREVHLLIDATRTVAGRQSHETRASVCALARNKSTCTPSAVTGQDSIGVATLFLDRTQQ